VPWPQAKAPISNATRQRPPTGLRLEVTVSVGLDIVSAGRGHAAEGKIGYDPARFIEKRINEGYRRNLRLFL
jgi:hypothetical protein